MEDLNLIRPSGIEERVWETIDNYLARFQRAILADDGPQVIGCAKELVETVAKAVIVERGGVVVSNQDYTKVISQAHNDLQRQPGSNLATEPLQGIFQGMKSIAGALGGLRNGLGTGHGRAREEDVEAEVLDIVVPATMLWCRWALHRLEHMIRGKPDQLISDLSGEHPFPRGHLAERLRSAGLAARDDADQRRLGVAVGQRSMKGTQTVGREGVESVASSEDLARWPLGYRIGLVQGLLIDEYGRLSISRWAARQIPHILSVVPEDELVLNLEQLDEQLYGLLLPEPLRSDSDEQGAIEQELSAGSVLMPERAVPIWVGLASTFETYARTSVERLNRYYIEE